MPAIAWSPDGRRLLVLHGHTLAIRDLDGAVVRTLPQFLDDEPTYLDARWLEDGRIAAVDRDGVPVMFSLRGDPYSVLPEPPRYGFAPRFVRLAGNGRAYVRLGYRDGVYATSPASETVWELIENKKWYGIKGSIVRAAIAYDARRLALHVADTWIVLDLTPGTDAEKQWGTWRAPVLERLTSPHVAFARSGRIVPLARDAIVDPAGVRAASIDDDPARVRVDFLDSKESLALEPGLGELVALAFGPDDRIACLAADGRIEIVPIP